MTEKYETRELDAALAVINMCIRGIDTIPEDFYSPADEFIVEAYQALDEAYCCLRSAVKEQASLQEKTTQ